MKNLLILLAVGLPALSQQTFDFKSLDKLGANAKESTNISLDANLLKMAGGLLGNDKDAASIQGIVSNLKSIQVRAYEFDGPGKYNDSDVEPLRAYLNAQQWNRIVDVKGKSQIYVLPMSNDRFGGLAIIATDPKAVTIVFIEGVLNMDDFGKLSGNLGIPDIKLMHGGKANGKTGEGK